MPQNLELNEDFIKNKIASIAKIYQISKAEALHTTEKVKADKLALTSSYLTIENWDDTVDDCDTLICAEYWPNTYQIINGVIPIPLPPYHPDCECYAEYYGSKKIEISDVEDKELKEYLKEQLYNLQLKVLEIQEKYLEKLSQKLTEYYNYINNNKPELLKLNVETWKQDSKDQKIKTHWDKVHIEIINLLLDMLEEVYELTTSVIKELYGDDFEYPTSEIEFYHKDGKTIDERLDRWFNPYK